MLVMQVIWLVVILHLFPVFNLCFPLITTSPITSDTVVICCLYYYRIETQVSFNHLY